MKILYNFASRSRPDKFMSAIENINSLSRHSDYTILCKIDLDDVETLAGIAHRELPNVLFAFGTSLSKVHAINRHIAKVPEWDILVNMSDDMVFLKEGFDLDIIEGFISDDDTFDKNLCLHFPDGYANDRLIIMSILGRDYYDRFGYVYHPEYKSLWCDNEQTAVAKSLGVYKFIDKQIFSHEHPAKNPLIQMDEQYRHTESFHTEDFVTFQKRQANNFYL